jgi:NADPH:quinone reductase-like Zn-dependent oxidoreductase
VRRFGGEPVAYGAGLESRVRELAPDGVDVAIDTVGTAEATEVSLALVTDRARIVTIAAAPSAKEHGFLAIGGMMPSSAEFRARVRPRLIALAADGTLVVPVARTFPLADAVEALNLLKSGHPGGKLALIP